MRAAGWLSIRKQLKLFGSLWKDLVRAAGWLTIWKQLRSIGSLWKGAADLLMGEHLADCMDDFGRIIW